MSHYPQDIDPGRPGWADPAPAPAKAAPPVLPIISFALSAVAVFFFTGLVGGAAIWLAGLAVRREERLGKIALAVAIVATVLGIAFRIMDAIA